MPTHTYDPSSAQSVTTARLILRLHRLSDAPALVALMTNPANTIYDPVHSPPEADTVAVYEQDIKRWLSEAAAGHKALWLICLLNPDGSEGPVIGCGGYPWLPANANGRPGNTGVLIDGSMARKGYGSEALAATLDYGFEVLRFEAIEQCTQERNEPYRRLMRSMGLESYGKRMEEVDPKGNVEWCYSVTKEQWEGLKKQNAAETE